MAWINPLCVTRQAYTPQAFLAQRCLTITLCTMATNENPTTQANKEEFLTFLERYHTDAMLCKLHYAKVMMGTFWAVVLVAWNGLRMHGEIPTQVSQKIVYIAVMVCGVHVLACLVTLLIARRKFIKELGTNVATMRERVWLVVQFVQRRGNVLLILAFTGQVLVLIATFFQLRVFSADGSVLLILLIPTVLLMVHGLTEVPTKGRLCRLYVRIASR
jgi:hypothetical protein